MNDIKPEAGQQWRRKTDGTIVRISRILDGDVGWERVDNERRGATYLYNFVNRYELIVSEDVLKREREEFRQRVFEERIRAAEKHGYTPEHDDKEGLVHLIRWAQEYTRLGKTVEAAGLMEAVLVHVSRNYVDAALYVPQ